MSMEWVEQTDSQFWPAKRRRVYVRGKKADREALFRYRLKSTLDSIWGDVPDAHPFADVLTETRGPYVDDDALEAGVRFIRMLDD